MARIYNFSAGPSTIAESVLKKAQAEMLDWNGCGASVMEVSHRGKAFVSMAEQSEQRMRSLLDIPDNYRVLFLQGGATTQFAMIPMNLLHEKKSAVYCNTGAWSKKAINDARNICEVRIATDRDDGLYNTIADQDAWSIDPNAAYLHYTDNETIHGVEFGYIPDSQGLPLVSDMSSNMLSRPIDVSRFGLIYAGAQKNMGCAGITLVIVRDDLLGKALPNTPSMLDYKKHADQGSMLNTPPSWSWYILNLVLEWIESQGGVSGLAEMNQTKAETLYKTIDGSDFYSNPVEQNYRSRMNVPFLLGDSDLEPVFLKEAADTGLDGLKGHRAVGGLRASIYNAMPLTGVQTLVEFMREFERTHG
ncbi:MAG: 3-phosphoserine/phosphohydroxythreonine transaminase [Gammaproteobacteria bacterium]|nr:3-phosphoserine/phosphohydroxythreonine transaminase [Gammaproteobacteria bacterium]